MLEISLLLGESFLPLEQRNVSIFSGETKKLSSLPYVNYYAIIKIMFKKPNNVKA